MTAREGHQGGQPEAANLSSILQAIRDRGPDALDVHDIPDIRLLKLTGIEYLWPNSNHHNGSIQGDNLLPKETPDDPATLCIPIGADITKATLELQTVSDDTTHKVVIKLPSTLDLECPSDAPLIDSWTQKRHFAAAPEPGRSLLAGLITILSLLISELLGSPITSDLKHALPRTYAALSVGAHPI